MFVILIVLVGRKQGDVSGETVLLSFDVESLPDKVMLGYIRYPVRAFVTNMLLLHVSSSWAGGSSV